MRITVRIDTICRFNETITSYNYKFSIGFNKEFITRNLQSEMEYYFEFYHLDQLTKSYLETTEGGACKYQVIADQCDFHRRKQAPDN
jgi:hypothetical protein